MSCDSIRRFYFGFATSIQCHLHTYMKHDFVQVKYIFLSFYINFCKSLKLSIVCEGSSCLFLNIFLTHRNHKPQHTMCRGEVCTENPLGNALAN